MLLQKDLKLKQDPNSSSGLSRSDHSGSAESALEMQMAIQVRSPSTPAGLLKHAHALLEQAHKHCSGRKSRRNGGQLSLQDFPRHGRQACLAGAAINKWLKLSVQALVDISSMPSFNCMHDQCHCTFGIVNTAVVGKAHPKKDQDHFDRVENVSIGEIKQISCRFATLPSSTALYRQGDKAARRNSPAGRGTCSRRRCSHALAVCRLPKLLCLHGQY